MIDEHIFTTLYNIEWTQNQILLVSKCIDIKNSKKNTDHFQK